MRYENSQSIGILCRVHITQCTLRTECLHMTIDCFRVFHLFFSLIFFCVFNFHHIMTWLLRYCTFSNVPHLGVLAWKFAFGFQWSYNSDRNELQFIAEMQCGRMAIEYIIRKSGIQSIEISIAFLNAYVNILQFWIGKGNWKLSFSSDKMILLIGIPLTNYIFPVFDHLHTPRLNRGPPILCFLSIYLSSMKLETSITMSISYNWAVQKMYIVLSSLNGKWQNYSVYL